MVAKLEKLPTESASPGSSLAAALRAIGSRPRLEVLRLLDSGDLSAGEVASVLGLTAAQARGHLKALVAADLVEPYPVEGGRRFRIDRRGAAFLNASVVSLLGRVSSPPLSSDSGPRDEVQDTLPMAAPPVPPRCLDCENAGFVRSVLDDLDRILGEAQEYQSRLQHLSSQVLAAHEEERKRIARELHDDTAQALTSILVRLRLLERSVDDGDARGTVEELRDLTAATLDSVRRMAVDLRPSALDDLGLVAALRSYTEKFSQRWPIQVGFASNGLRRRLPAPVELVLYRVIQEALSNVAKHSGARRVEVRLSRKQNVLTAAVSDDGRGFQLDRVVESGRGGLGLFGMGERLALVGGSLDIDSRPGEGTTVTARVPLAPPARKH